MPDYWFTITVSNFPGESSTEAWERLEMAIHMAYPSDRLSDINLDNEGEEDPE